MSLSTNNSSFLSRLDSTKYQPQRTTSFCHSLFVTRYFFRQIINMIWNKQELKGFKMSYRYQRQAIDNKDINYSTFSMISVWPITIIHLFQLFAIQLITYFNYLNNLNCFKYLTQKLILFVFYFILFCFYVYFIFIYKILKLYSLVLSKDYYYYYFYYKRDRN